MSACYAIIAGGGTAGHVVPALAIGRALVDRGHDPATVHFVGSKRAAIDRRLLGESPFPSTLLPGRGIARRLTLDNVGALIGFAAALVQAAVLLLRLRPKVVVSMGGYAAAPCAIVGSLLRIPLVLAEQNAVPTATHRMLSRFATASAVPYEGTPLPNPIVTGNPVRDEILAVDRSATGKRTARQLLDLPVDRVVVFAFGGSLGSRTINDAVIGLAQLWADRGDIAIRHVIGERDWDELAGAVDAGGSLVYQPVRYEDRMPEALAAADLVICRSGGSVAELAVVGRAAILVPLPIAPFDHQAANAGVLVRAGAAIMLRDPEVTTERLAREVGALLGEPGTLERMGEAALLVGQPDAAAKVADVVVQYARK